MVKKSKIARTGVTLIEYFLIALLVGAVAFGLTPVFKNANKYMETHRAQQNKGSFNKEGSFMSWFKPGKGEQGVSPLDPGGGLGPSDEINFTFNCGTVNMTAEEAKCGVIPGACGILTDGCWICNADIQMWQWATNKNTCRDYWFGNIKETCLAKCVDLTTPDYLPPIYGDGTTRNYCYICANSGDSIGYWYRMKSGSGTACDSFWNNPHSCFGSDTSFAVPCGSCTGLPPLSGYYHEKTKNGGDSCWICDGNQWINTNVGSVCMQAWVNEPATCPDLNDLIADTDYPYCGCSAPPPARGQNGITVGTDKCWICRNNTWERESDSTKCQEFWIDNKCEGYTPPLPLPCNGATTTPTSPALGAGNCWLCTNPSEPYRQNPIDKDPLYSVYDKPCNIYWVDSDYPPYLNIPGEPDDLDTVCSAPFSSLGSAEPGIAQDPVSGKWGCWACNELNAKTWARVEWDGARFEDVTSPEYQACHSFWMEGKYPNDYTLPVHNAFSWGGNTNGQLGIGTDINSGVPINIRQDFVMMDGGRAHSCGIDSGKKLWCWGNNEKGNLGIGTTSPYEVSPVKVTSVQTFDKLSVGYDHSCALDASGEAWCWGDNTDMMLGVGASETSVLTPQKVVDGHVFIDISAGKTHTCAIDNANQAWCWGKSSDGQTGTTLNTIKPTKVPGVHNFIQISAGVNHTCAIDVDKVGWCWGGDRYGQLGDGRDGWDPKNLPNYYQSLTPVKIVGPTFKQISAGYNYTCGVDSSDMLYCWGHNSAGQIGTNQGEGDVISRARHVGPKEIDATTWKKIKEVYTKDVHTCAISYEGKAYCAGSNIGVRRLGWGDLNKYYNMYGFVELRGVGCLSPIPDKYFIHVRPGVNHTLAITDDTPPIPPTPSLPLCDGSITPPGSPDTGKCYLCTNPSEAYRQNPIDGSSLYSLYDKPCNIYWADEDYPPFLNIPGDPDDLDTVCSASFSSLGSADPGIAQDPSSGKWGCWACNENNSKTWQRIEWDGDRFVNVASPEYQACHSFWMEGTYPNSYPLGGGGSGGGGGGSGTVEDPNLDVGSAVAWGYNSVGQLGDGTTVNRNIPVTILGEHTFKQVSAGYNHTCALDTTGKALCWGDNYFGALGNGTTDNSSVLVEVSSSRDFKQISAGDYHTCALDTSGKVWCWGDNRWGQLGNGTTDSSPSPVMVSASSVFKEISVGYYHTCALDTTGKAWCWGYNEDGQLGNKNTVDSSVPVIVSTEVIFKHITAGCHHTCALDTTDTTWCWGSNEHGQLGINTPSVNNSTTPVKVTVGGFKQISSGYGHICALDADGKIWCWGLFDPDSQLAFTLPAKLALNNSLNFKQISAGYEHTCVLDTDDKAWCWGSNSSGQLGNGTTDNSSVLVEVSGSYTFSQISAGGGHVVAITRDPSGPTMPTLPSGPAYAWGQNIYGQIGDGTETDKISGPVSIGKTFIDIDTGGASESCGIDPTGQAWCWGFNRAGELGDDSTTKSSIPVKVKGSHLFWKISIGQGHTCALDTDGKAWCWGENYKGQVGNRNHGLPYGNESEYHTPIDVEGGHTFKDIVATAYYTCAIDTAGQAWCWGRNVVGQLGNGESGAYTFSDVPVKVSGSYVFKKITASGDFMQDDVSSYTCALDEAGKAWCWGHIGFDHSTYSAIPVQVDFAGSFKDISAGLGHVCGLDTSDKIWCWGDGSTGALGIGPSGKLLKPTTSVAGTYKSVSAGNAYTCAVSTTGQGYCWGMNNYGRFGDGTQTHSNVPVPVLGGPYLKINVDNSYHTTAIKAP